MCVPRRPPSVGFMAEPTNRSLLDFENQIKKISRWFWGLNHQTSAADFRVQTEKPDPPVLRSNRKKPILTPNWRKPSEWFWSQTQNHSQTVRLGLRLNQKTHASHLYVHGADRTQCYPTSRSPDHQVLDLYDHLQFSAPGLLLLPRSLSLHVMSHLPPAHHEIRKHDSPTKQRITIKQPKCLDSISNYDKSVTHHN
jgi:hypothetical protein